LKDNAASVSIAAACNASSGSCEPNAACCDYVAGGEPEPEPEPEPELPPPPPPLPSPLECPAGSGLNVAVGSCELCPAGQYSATGICQPCVAPNVISSDQTACEPQEQELPRPAPPPSPEQNSVRAAVVLDTSLDNIGSAGDATYTVFTLNFKTDIAMLLNVNVDRLRVNSITAGSVIVDFTVLPGSDGEPVATRTITTAFAVPGVVIAGVTTLSAIDHSSITVTTPESVTSDVADSEAHGTPPTVTEQDDTTANVGKVVVIVLVLFGLCSCVGRFMGMATEQKYQLDETHP
jgi:hypothetical protein